MLQLRVGDRDARLRDKLACELLLRLRERGEPRKSASGLKAAEVLGALVKNPCGLLVRIIYAMVTG